MNSRNRRKLEAERHNLRHMKQMEWEKVKPLFAYLHRLCRTRGQLSKEQSARALIKETLYWMQGDTIPYFRF